MRTLAEDREEMVDGAGARWVQRARHQYGIRPDEASCWFVQLEQSFTPEDGGRGWDDTHIVGIQPSPGDAIAYAECMAADARRDGFGRWTMEVIGDGMTSPLVLRVRPIWDESGDD